MFEIKTQSCNGPEETIMKNTEHCILIRLNKKSGEKISSVKTFVQSCMVFLLE